MDGLFKYKQSWVDVPHGKLRLVAFKEKYDSPIAGHRGGKNIHHRMVLRRYDWPCMKEDITHFVNVLVRCRVNQTSYQSKAASWSRCLSRRTHDIVYAWT